MFDCFTYDRPHRSSWLKQGEDGKYLGIFYANVLKKIVLNEHQQTDVFFIHKKKSWLTNTFPSVRQSCQKRDTKAEVEFSIFVISVADHFDW